MARRAKMGRPVRAEGVSSPVTIRASSSERAAWEAAAGERSLSDWIRDVLNAAAATADEPSDRTIRTLPRWRGG